MPCYERLPPHCAIICFWGVQGSEPALEYGFVEYGALAGVCAEPTVHRLRRDREENLVRHTRAGKRIWRKQRHGMY